MVDWTTITIEPFVFPYKRGNEVQHFTYYAIAKDGEILIDTWPNGSTAPSLHAKKRHELEAMVTERDPALIALLTESPAEKQARIDAKIASFHAFLAGIRQGETAE